MARCNQDEIHYTNGMNMMKKTLIAASLMLTAGMANAAATNGSLSFNWQGTTPAAPIVAGTWKFKDAMGNDYTPATAALNFVTNSDGSLSINSATNNAFFITVEGSGTLSTIGAYLGNSPVSSGFVASKQLALSTTASPAEDQVAVLMNNQPLAVGSSNSVSVTGVSGTQKEVSLSLAAKASASSFAEKTVVGFSVPVIFAVDITTP